MTKRHFLWPLGAVLIATTSLAGADSKAKPTEDYAMRLISPAFAEGAPIPERYTCDGANVSPPLEWGEAPAGTRAFALICDDPDAPVGTWVHWVVYGMPATATGLPEMVAPLDALPGGGRQGMNDFRRVGYGGPCPPPGRPHHYFFKLYALDADPALKPRATKADLLRAMQGHILGQAQLMGTYQRGR